MAHISGQIHIDAPPELVFDTVADSRNEPRYNSMMRSVELLTGEPIGAGSRFRALMGRGGLEMLVTITTYQPSSVLGVETTSGQMDTTGALIFRPDPDDPGSTTMSWEWEVTPQGWLRLLGPAFGWVGSRMERRIWTGAKAELERRG